MTKFIPGKTYSGRSICDYDCIFSFIIKSRTAKTVTIVDRDGDPVRRGIKVDEHGVEFFFPHGQYSMAPVIKAA